MLVGTETKEGHDEIMEEILRRLEENNLHVKPEKYVWKVRKIRFIGVVKGPNGIEMEKEKVDRILSWPEPKNMKDIRKFLGLANLSQTSFGHISTNSSTILTVSMATESP